MQRNPHIVDVGRLLCDVQKQGGGKAHETKRKKVKEKQSNENYLHNSVINQIHWFQPFLRSEQLLSHSRNSQHFMKLPRLQDSDNFPYPKPNESSPQPPILFSLTFILILSSHLLPGLRSGLFPTKNLYTFYLFSFPLMRGTPPAHLILLDFIITVQQPLLGKSSVDMFLQQRGNTQ
jgi:hypothetical protein